MLHVALHLPEKSFYFSHGLLPLCWCSSNSLATCWGALGFMASSCALAGVGGCCHAVHMRPRASWCAGRCERALLCSACNDNNIAAPVDAYGGDGSDEEGSNTAGGSVRAHAYRGKQYFAVRIGDSLAGLAGSSLSQRAVVGYHGGDLWCLFCPSGRQRGCVHVQMVQASGEAGSNRSGSGIPWLDASTAEQRLQEALDLAIDKYIITCQSRLPLKQRTRDDPGLLAVLEGQ